MVAAARPVVTVSGTGESTALPSVFLAPIRPDVVRFVHTNMSKNARQAHAVKRNAGHQHSAESWGTGRAVARVPRIAGSGTNRAGQGAFANSCRKGRMFAPIKVHRKLHRKINVHQKRFAVCAAIAATAVAPLLAARGHAVQRVPEVPLVVSDAAESMTRTKEAIRRLESVHAYDDVLKSKHSKKLRAGKGKMRNRRYITKKGPLVVYAKNRGIRRAFRNLPGVELVSVRKLNLLQLAPGGHVGRFVVWTKSAFESLDAVFGTLTEESKEKTRGKGLNRSGFRVPVAVSGTADLQLLLQSDAIRSCLAKRKQSAMKKRMPRENPLRSRLAMLRLNPYAAHMRA